MRLRKIRDREEKGRSERESVIKKVVLIFILSKWDFYLLHKATLIAYKSYAAQNVEL